MKCWGAEKRGLVNLLGKERAKKLHYSGSITTFLEGSGTFLHGKEGKENSKYGKVPGFEAQRKELNVHQTRYLHPPDNLGNDSFPTFGSTSWLIHHH